jgi:Flp pilus assembly protein TadD
LHPGDSGYRGKLGVAYLQKADFDAAITEWRAALEISPQDATLHYNLGLGAEAQRPVGRGSARVFKEAAELDPKQADIRYTLGVTLWANGRV